MQRDIQCGKDYALHQIRTPFGRMNSVKDKSLNCDAYIENNKERNLQLNDSPAKSYGLIFHLMGNGSAEDTLSQVFSHPVNVNAYQFVHRFIRVVFGEVAIISPIVIDENIRLLTCDVPEQDRMISFLKATYLVKNFGYIYMGLIANDGFRNAFKDTVTLEIDLANNNISENEINALRNSANKWSKAHNSKSEDAPFVILNLSEYHSRSVETMCNMISDSLAAIESYEDEFNQLVDDLTEDDRFLIGYCVSNFAYLIRAFAKIPAFFAYTCTIIESVKKTLAQ